MEVKIWLAIGFLAQAMFSMRFVVQWIYSEKHRRSLIPVAFWYFSLAGGSLLLAYAIYQRDPVFIVGQAGGLVVYVRNLYLIIRERRSRQNPEAS
ncbi:MAG TPA: lipid-A-disaccharide synthase N-terminal domain-containing protein [Gammaproteobacteria bacterium]|nr:lipid-A-disaccharide synthase N-terminal domain-containing protein [Gammaproteobacteria bacterium]